MWSVGNGVGIGVGVDIGSYNEYVLRGLKE